MLEGLHDGISCVGGMIQRYRVRKNPVISSIRPVLSRVVEMTLARHPR